jgi:hypothetical protein
MTHPRPLQGSLASPLSGFIAGEIIDLDGRMRMD